MKGHDDMEDSGSLYLRPTWIGPSQLARDSHPTAVHAPTTLPGSDLEAREPLTGCDANLDGQEFNL